MKDPIERQDAIDAIERNACNTQRAIDAVMGLPSAQPEPEDYTEIKQEFLRMASYIDVLLECSDEQRESLMGFISRLAEYMPWTERD